MTRDMMWLSKGSTVFLMLLLLVLPVRTLANNMAMFERGHELLKEQNYAEALLAYEAFVKENPQHHLVPAAMWTMANIYLTINEEYETAARFFRQIVNENPDTEWEVFACDRLGYCLEEQEKWGEAAEVYEPLVRELSISGNDAVTLTWIDGLKGRLLLCYRNKEDHESIIAVYEEILSENPAAQSAPQDQYNLAQTYLDIDNSKKAAENFVLMVERYPVSNYAQRVNDEHGEMLTSQVSYDWTPYSTFQSGLTLGQTGQYDEALARFEEVIKVKRDAGMAYAARFQIELIEYRKSGDAAALREKVASSSDDYPFGLGGVNVAQLDNLLGGIIGAEEAIASNPDDISGYIQMGQCYYFTQAYQRGIEAYQKAVGIAPDNTNVHNMLGYCHIGLRQYDEAISAFQSVIDLTPQDPNAYDSMAEGYYLKGDTTTAVQFYERALATDSSFSHPYYMLGQIYSEHGQNDKAIAYLQRYLEIDPGGIRSENAQNLLEQLNPPASNDVEP